jgi:hypothetical protein
VFESKRFDRLSHGVSINMGLVNSIQLTRKKLKKVTVDKLVL